MKNLNIPIKIRNMVVYSKSPKQERLDYFISQTRTLIKTINSQHNSVDKIPYILEYFNIITNDRNFRFFVDCINERRSHTSHFATINVSFANKLHSEFIISNFFHVNKNVPINEYQFSDFLAQITDLYGFQIKTKKYDE